MVCTLAANGNTSTTGASGELLNYRIRMFKIAGFCWDTSLPYYTTILATSTVDHIQQMGPREDDF